MASAFLSRPGTDTGPCVGFCNHTDCNWQRHLANTICHICGKRIGFETRFLQDDKGHVHESCQIHKIEAERQDGDRERAIAVDLAKVNGYVLVNTSRVVWQAGSHLIVGDEPHVYPELGEAAEYRNMYAGDNDNPHIHIFKLVPVDPAELVKVYAEHPYEEE